jgi:FkbH-like protein
MYKTEEVRKTAYTSSGGSYHHFLKDCDIRLTVAPLSSASVVRVYELSQRTNQLNTSGRRYTREELDAMIKENAADSTYVLSCADRFGEYGIIGFCVLSPASQDVESFFMSCRVQRKRVENAFFNLLDAELAERGAGELQVNFRETAKNTAAARMLSELGFTYRPDGDGAGRYVRALSQPFPETDVVAVERRRAPEMASA